MEDYQNAIDQWIKLVGGYPNKTLDEKLVVNALGLTGEAGEIADKIKKYVWYAPIDLNQLKKSVRMELGDVLYHVVQLASLLGFSINDIMKDHLAKVISRAPVPEVLRPANSYDLVPGAIVWLVDGPLCSSMMPVMVAGREEVDEKVVGFYDSEGDNYKVHQAYIGLERTSPPENR